ncbi:MAG: phage major capsid protein [Oscillospiraceae bacterium]|nr:phage major capsid protein [Oscillospiraceae bacterium]
MSSGVSLNRTFIDLPSDVSGEILQKTQEESAVMHLARRISLPGRGVTIPVISGDPTAAWVAETAAKPVSQPTIGTKLMSAYKIAVIETFSDEFVRDIPALYDALVSRLPGALAKCFDATVIGAVEKPGDNFDTLANCTAQSLIPTSGHTVYDALVAADTDIATHGGVLNGFALGAQARGILLGAVDSTGRPLFINSAAAGAIPMILGAPTYMNKGIYKAGAAGSSGTPAVVGIAGDWTQAMYGTVEGVKISFNDTGVVTAGSGTSASTINLWQQNMIAVRAEIEVGFRADTAVFNLLTGAVPTE